MSRAFNNWKVVSLSLIGATTFWFFNALNKNYDASINYPVEFLFDRDSVVVMKPLPNTVNIDVSSGGWNLFRKTFWFNVTPIQIALDNPTEIGFYTRSSLLPIVADQLSELKVNHLITDTIYIDIEPKRSLKMAVSIDSMDIDLAENHRLTSKIIISPDSIWMTGPKSCIDTLGATYYFSLPTKGINSTYNRRVEIQLPSKKFVNCNPEKVNVKFDVDKFERHSIEIPLDPENFPEDSSLYLSRRTVQVFYTIAESEEEDFNEADFAITADLLMMNSKDSTVLAMLVYYPENTLDVEVIPEHVKIKHAKHK